MKCKTCGFDSEGHSVHPCKLSKEEKKEGLKMLKAQGAWLKYKKLGEFIEYRSIFVKESARRRGIGTKLLRQLRKKGKIKTFVNTNKNDWLGKFLLSVGFKFTDEKAECYQAVMIYE